MDCLEIYFTSSRYPDLTGVPAACSANINNLLGIAMGVNTYRGDWGDRCPRWRRLRQFWDYCVPESEISLVEPGCKPGELGRHRWSQQDCIFGLRIGLGTPAPQMLNT